MKKIHYFVVFVLVVIGILFAISFNWNTLNLNTFAKVILTIFALVGAALFLMRTRNEGQRYVQGVLGSVSMKQTPSESKIGNQNL